MSNTYLAINGEAGNWEEAITQCGGALKAAGCIGDAFTPACIEREKEFPTGLPSDVPVAIPHSKTEDIFKNAVCLLRLKKPVKFYRMDSDDEYVNTRLVINIAINDNDNHVDFLQHLMSVVTDSEKMENCMAMPIEAIPDYLAQIIE